MLLVGIIPMLVSAYRYFIPKWVKTVGSVTDPTCIMGSSNIAVPYICAFTIEYTVKDTEMKTHVQTSYHRELFEGDVIDMWYDQNDPTRVRVI